jgi:hypothetical protein
MPQTKPAPTLSWAHSRSPLTFTGPRLRLVPFPRRPDPQQKAERDAEIAQAMAPLPALTCR